MRTGDEDLERGDCCVLVDSKEELTDVEDKAEDSSSHHGHAD